MNSVKEPRLKEALATGLASSTFQSISSLLKPMRIMFEAQPALWHWQRAMSCYVCSIIRAWSWFIFIAPLASSHPSLCLSYNLNIGSRKLLPIFCAVTSTKHETYAKFRLSPEEEGGKDLYYRISPQRDDFIDQHQIVDNYPTLRTGISIHLGRNLRILGTIMRGL